MTTRSQDISQEIKTAAAEITSPQLSFVFDAQAAQGFDVGGPETDKPTIGDMFNLAGGQENQNEQLLALASGSVDGLQARGAALSKHHKDTAERERRQKGKTGDAVLFALLDQIDALEAEIARNEERLEVLEGWIEGLENTLEAIENGEDVTDENGELKDKRAEEAVKAYEDEHGVEVDRDDPEKLQDVLKSVQDKKAEVDIEIKRGKKLLNEKQETAQELSQDHRAMLAKAGDEHASQEDKEELNSANAMLESDEKQVEIARARGFNDTEEQDYIEMLTQKNADDLFANNALGSGNPFESGVVTSEFGKMADTQDTALKPADDLSADHSVQEKFDLGKLV